MKIRILGTGTSQVSKDRASSSTYIEIKHKKILLDCGSGALMRMDQAGIRPKDIGIVFISHFHIDHISDLFAFLWALKYPELKRRKKLEIIGPEGFIELYNNHIKPLVFPKPFDLFEIEVKEIYDEIIFPDFTVKAMKSRHTKESIAYKFIEKKTLVISGDTDYDNKLIEFSKNADILILECSHKKKIEGHLTPKECGFIAKEANVRRLIITHFYPISKETRLEETKKIFENTIMAEDLMEITL